MKLKDLFLADNNVIKCSDYEYLIITNWFKLISSKISCPNQDTLFENGTLHIYNYSHMTVQCDAKNKINVARIYVSNLSPTKNPKIKLSKKTYRNCPLPCSVDSHNYSFQAILDNNYKALVHMSRLIGRRI